MKEKAKKLFHRIEKDWRLQIVAFLVLMILVVSTYLLIKWRMNMYSQIYEDDFSWVYQIDEIKEENNRLMVSGFAFRLDEDAKADNCEIVLRNIRTGKRYFAEMSFYSRQDVNCYFLCEYDYTESGFIASFVSESLELDTEVYEILLQPTDRNKAYSTSIYYVNGEMMFTNPEEFIPLETAGTDLEKITTDGILRVYRPDFGIYVYQYEGELYWIAEPNYGFVKGDTLIHFQMNTTQVKNLPAFRLEKGETSNNISFQFMSKELTEWDTGKYRVTKCTLPLEYSITEIWTGNHINKWIWKQNFRPWYEFLDDL